MNDIKNSDDWECFRCNQSQIIVQRVACYEFFEYVRRESSRASTLNDPEFWSKDHTWCCGNGPAKKRPAENGIEVKKPKRRKAPVDPEYRPEMDRPPPVQTTPVSSFTTAATSGQFVRNTVLLPKPPVQLIPRPYQKDKDNDIEFVRKIPAPKVVLNPIRKPTLNMAPGYRSFLPTGIHVRPGMYQSLLFRALSKFPLKCHLPVPEVPVDTIDLKRHLL